MGSQSGLRVVRNPSNLTALKSGGFRQSLADSLKVLDSTIPSVGYPKDAILFMEGQPARGIFAVCSGRVKITTSSLEGKLIILKVAQAGELVGLPAILSGKPYEVTAVVTERAWVNFIPRGVFLRFLRANPQALVEVAQLLTDSHYVGHAVIQSLALSRSAPEKLARFFLDWSATHTRGQDRLRITLTQAEIGEMIGVSRETVSRLLTIFQKRNLVTVKGEMVDICNRHELQVLASA
jgi:CRP/FNR family cyclic AMP-dependent transcriptional regulator